MNVYLVTWGFTMEVESVWATREQAEAQVWALGDVGHEVVEMAVQGLGRRTSTGWPVAA